MKVKNKKIYLTVCSLLMLVSIAMSVYIGFAPKNVLAENAVVEYIATDTETKSAWETAGYGAEGYLIFGVNDSNKPAVYSNMYTEQGNDGKTEITLYKNTGNDYYYDSSLTTTDSTAPISKFVVNGQSAWQTISAYWADQPDLYIPGTETTYPVRMHNNHDGDAYHDLGVGFSLTATEKTYVTVYVLDWSKKVSSSNAITVGLFSGIQSSTVYAYGATSVETMEERYGEALEKTTVTSQGAYVTFVIEGAGNYQIVAYYDNEGTSSTTLTPMITGLFFDDERPAVKGRYFATDTETKSAWETAGYGTEGYLIFGVNDNNKPSAYSNMYTEQGNDGKTEITLHKNTDNDYYYDSSLTTTDSTAPISKFVVNGQSAWQTISAYWADQPDLYAPGTQTLESVRMHNNHDGDAYHDLGVGFSLTATEKTYVTVYVLDWSKKVSSSNAITVGLFSGIQSTTVYAYGATSVETIKERYGVPLSTTTVTSQGAYVTFVIEGAGNYQIVAYYDNEGTSSTTLTPMITGLFFDKDGFEEEIVTPTIEAVVDTETKSAWESAGYGTEGYIIFGTDSSNAKVGYSNMYTKQGNDGKTPISLYKHGDNTIYYEELGKTTDSTAPISELVMLGHVWANFTPAGRNSYLYKPGTTEQSHVRLQNTNTSPNRDMGLAFSLRAEKTLYTSVYVTDMQLEWGVVDHTANPITVAIYKTQSLLHTPANDHNGGGVNTNRLVDDYYGTPLGKVALTTSSAYVTFELNEPGNYAIVAYYDNDDATKMSPITPSITGLFFDEPEPALPEITTSVFVDTTSKSAWEANGYGSDGYLVLGGVKAYSNMYTEQGNDGKTEISLHKNGDNSIYYNSTLKSTDSTAPISGFVVNGSSAWEVPTGTHWVGQPDLYIPGTETTYPVRLHNNIAGPYKDFGLGFTLRETEKIYVTVYVLDWEKKVSESLPITVGLYSGIKNTTVYGYGNNTATTVDEHYGTALVETTVTTQGAYVTFAIEGAGNYQIVAYYDNQGTSNASIAPMLTGLFFDKEIYPEVTSTSLSLEGDIGVNYYVGARGQDLTGGYLQVKYANGNIQQVPVPDRNTDGTYKFQVKIAAKDYAAKMKVRLFDKDGNAISKAFTYSAASYVKSILSAGAAVYGEKLVALATALDDYGKAAENLFYGESNTFTADLSAVTTSTLTEHKFSVSGSLPAGVKLSDFSLSLKSTTSLKIYFTAETLEGVVCKVNGAEVEPKATGVANEYCIVIENISAKDLDTNYVVSIGGYQLTLNTLSYSLRALEYSSNASLKTAMQALYLYNQAANAYFEEV